MLVTTFQNGLGSDKGQVSIILLEEVFLTAFVLIQTYIQGVPFPLPRLWPEPKPAVSCGFGSGLTFW